jgi:hypothetical protein
MMKAVVALKINPPQLVSELIDPTLATWKEELLTEFFLPMDVSTIMGIPLCTRRQSDCWAWNFDTKGLFSVRSTYRMMETTKFNRANYFECNAG